MAGITDGTISVPFINTTGRPPGPAQQLQEITRPGVNGHEHRKQGVRAAPGKIEVTVAATGSSGAQSAAEALEALQGEVCTFTDIEGQAFSNCVLTAVSINDIRFVSHLVGATGDHLLDATLTLTDVRSSP